MREGETTVLAFPPVLLMHAETHAQAQTWKGSTEETEDTAFDASISGKYNWYCLASRSNFKLKKKKNSEYSH